MRWSGRREGRSDQPRLKKRQFQVFQDFTNSTHLHCLNSRHQKVLEDIVEDLDNHGEDEDEFTGHSCLLVTWKTNPEIEKFKVKHICLSISKYDK